jgi:XRE family aerobic/anaerobic benzoate catabolism transcriptional regulator
MQAYLAALGQRVREARAKRGMARRILARDSGVSERYLAQLESGAGNPSIAVLCQIAMAVDYPLADLVAGVGDGGADFARILRLLETAPRSELPKIRAQVELLLTGKGGRDKRQRVSLIGLRGAGKSTLGRLLAERFDFPFIELNRLVEQEYGGSIGEILALSGQPAFRRYERRCLEAVIRDHDGVVIATGGGIVSEAATFSLLLEKTHTVWVEASPEEHLGRVIAQGDLRPMAKNDEAMEDLKAILKAREPYHRMADAVVRTSGRTIPESFEQLDAVVARLLSPDPAQQPEPVSPAHG